MTKPKKGQVQVGWGATPSQQKYGYRSVMFVTLVSGGQWSRHANNMSTWGDGELPEETFDSIDEAKEAVEKAGFSLDYAIYA